MPAAITHYLHAERVLDRLEEVTPQRRYDRDAFFWGAQGPDIFQCHRFFPWQKGESLAEYGRRFHAEDPAEVLEKMRDFWQGRQHKKISSSYIAGFLCHYSLDRSSHPYVGYLQKELQESHSETEMSVLHHEIESALDIVMMRREHSELASEFDLRNALPKNKEVQEEIAQLYSQIIAEVLEKEISSGQLVQMMEDARFCFGMLNDRTGLKKRLLQTIESHQKTGRNLSAYFRDLMEDGEYDYANTGHEVWNDGEKERTDDYFEVFSKSVEEAAKMIAAFFRGDPMSPLTGGKSF